MVMITIIISIIKRISTFYSGRSSEPGILAYYYAGLQLNMNINPIIFWIFSRSHALRGNAYTEARLHIQSLQQSFCYLLSRFTLRATPRLREDWSGAQPV